MVTLSIGGSSYMNFADNSIFSKYNLNFTHDQQPMQMAIFGLWRANASDRRVIQCIRCEFALSTVEEATERFERIETLFNNMLAECKSDKVQISHGLSHSSKVTFDSAFGIALERLYGREGIMIFNTIKDGAMPKEDLTYGGSLGAW